MLEAALAAEPGQMVGLTDDPGEGPRLQDLVADEPLDITVHDGFEYWVADVDDDSSGVAAALEQANQVASPTARLTSVTAAYWTAMGSKEHLRWVMPHDEEVLLSALARLHVAGKDRLVPDSRLVGMFRAHGLLAPVWDLPVGTGAEVARGAGGRSSAPTWTRPWRPCPTAPSRSPPRSVRPATAWRTGRSRFGDSQITRLGRGIRHGA